MTPSLLVGIAAVITSVGLFVLSAGIGVYFLSNSGSQHDRESDSRT